LALIEENRPWLQGFNDFYSRELAPIVDDIAAARALAAKEVWKRTLILSAVAIPITAVLFVVVEPQAALFGIFAAIAGYQFYARKPARAFSSQYKQQVVHRLGQFFGLEYEEEPSHFDPHRYKSLKLIPRYDKADTEDGLTGQHENVSIKFLEAHLQQERRSKNSTNYVTVFKGPLFTLTFPKPFIGTTLLQTDKTMIGNFLSGAFTDGERVRLEDPEFEDQFEVYSTSQVEARFILTPDFMERLLRLQRQFGKHLQAAFQDNEMLIAINGAKNRFEAGSLDDQDDPHAPIARTIEELKAIFDLIETLNLTSQTRAS
jgi:hypothetical protein